MNRQYPTAVTGFLLITLAIAVLFLVICSPSHGDNDFLFWFMALTALLLFLLCVMLHSEKEAEERGLFIRVFFLINWAVAILMAGYAIWTRTGRVGPR